MAAEHAARVARAVALAEERPQRLLCIVGPTASGKTELAIEVCERTSGEIISADSVQVYRSLDIGSGKLAGFERPKRALGSLGCGAVRLAPAEQGRLGLAEGIESAMSAMQLFGVPCWATLGNERFGLVAIPESVRELYLFIDNDAGGALAEERALRAYAAPNRVIHSRTPASPGFDWNDELKSRLAGKSDPLGRGEGAFG